MSGSIPHALADFGSRLEAYRLSRNIPQAVLARSAGISRSTLSRLESGQGGTLDTLLRVMRALELGERFQDLVPDARADPFDPLAGRRQRASPAQAVAEPAAGWRWGDGK